MAADVFFHRTCGDDGLCPLWDDHQLDDRERERGSKKGKGTRTITICRVHRNLCGVHRNIRGRLECVHYLLSICLTEVSGERGAGHVEEPVFLAVCLFFPRTTTVVGGSGEGMYYTVEIDGLMNE